MASPNNGSSRDTCAALVAGVNRGVRRSSARIELVGERPFGPALRLAEFRLGNGLGVLLLVDRSAPVLSFQTWFRVGSRDDPPGKTGLAHFLEHLMFNETENLPPGAFDRVLEAAGAETNAATWVDYTCYYVTLPSSELDLVARLEAERMARLRLSEPLVAAEREVVANERLLRVDDDVEGTANETLYRTAFRRHPYGQPTVGWMADIRGFGVRDCQRFYRRYYAPNNATIVLVGDMEPGAALRTLQKHYGRLKATRINASSADREPPQRAERRIVLERPATSPKLLLGYRTPAARERDHVVLTVLNELLCGGRSSRLYRELVLQHEIASEVRGLLAPFRDPGLYEIWVALRQDREVEDALVIIERRFRELAQGRVKVRELDRVKRRIELDFWQALETAGGKADQIGFHAAVLGNAGELFERLELLEGVTGGDLQRVARRYLSPRTRTQVVVKPSPAEPAAGGCP